MVQKGGKAAFHTLGCKLNFAETSTLARELFKHGFERAELSDNPDVFVINTCSVTENANRKCRQLVNRARREAPNAVIAVTGCYAQLKPNEIAALGVDMVLGAGEKFNLAKRILDYEKKGKPQIYSCEIEHVNQFCSSYSKGDRTRSFLKVQDGCDYSCTFCTIPLARGKSRSDSIPSIVDSAHQIGASGIKEVVLTGVNIGDFGANTGENLLGLITALDEVSSVDRFRISSIEPNLLTNEIIQFVAHSKRFMPHFHIPLQSGSDTILKKMRRRYLSSLYRDRVETIKEKMPHCCIGVDVIVGFPGETDVDFETTYSFLNDLDVSYLHVFTYSERENTVAYEMQDVVDPIKRSERSKRLHLLSEKKKNQFYASHYNTQQKVLFESSNEDGEVNGFTENYIKVVSTCGNFSENSIAGITLSQLGKDGAYIFGSLKTVPLV